MILIADSGSTKSHWTLSENATIVRELYTTGINPFYQTEVEIANIVHTNIRSKLPNFQIDAIYFYGAGCSFPDKKDTVLKALRISYQSVRIEINNDLLGSARSLLGKETGIACILGTGSNSCFYNGSQIADNVSPLGFILGDEGSGAVLGKLFIGDLLKRQLPKDLEEIFYAETHITPAEIMNAVYRRPFPNRFLAQFAPFLSAHKMHPHIHRLIVQSFIDFFRRNAKQYDTSHYEVNFSGSIAYYFKDELQEAASQCDIRLGLVQQSPMQGLIAYHSK